MDHRAFVEHNTCVMDHEPCFMEHRTSYMVMEDMEGEREAERWAAYTCWSHTLIPNNKQEPKSAHAFVMGEAQDCLNARLKYTRCSWPVPIYLICV